MPEPMYQPHYPNEPDWAADEELLYSRCCAAIEWFAKEHPDEVLSFIAFYSEPEFGYVLISLDTLDNEYRGLTSRQNGEAKPLIRQLTGENAWEVAEEYLSQRPLFRSSNGESTAYFAYSNYEEVKFEQWEVFSEIYAGLPPEDTPEYEESCSRSYELMKHLTGHILLIYWKVFERLIAEGTLKKVKLSSPFRLGYEFPYVGGMNVVRSVNEPAADGQK